MSDPSRMNDIAMRRMRSQGDYQGAARLATNQQWLDARFGGRNASLPAPAMMPGAMPPSIPQPPPMQPGGRLVPGRSAGSMVWQPDAPPPMAPAPEPMPTPMMPPMRQPEQPAADAMPMPAPDLTINPLTGLPFALATPNVPSGFMAQQAKAQNATFPGLAPAPAGLYTEAPPPVDSIPIPGTAMIAPVFNGKVSPQTLPMVKPEAPLPPGMVPTEANRGGITYRAPGVPETPRAPQVRRIINAAGQEVDAQWNPQTNQWEPVAMAGGSATGAGTGSTTGAAGTSPLDKLRALRSRTGGQM